MLKTCHWIALLIMAEGDWTETPLLGLTGGQNPLLLQLRSLNP
jgi:hypothetical protein